MKQFFTTCLKASIAFGVCSIVSLNAAATGKPYTNYTITKTKAFSSRNNQSVKICPDIVKREMRVKARDNDGKEVSFFVFDLRGALVQQYKLKSGERQRLAGLAKGTYLYHVFCGDDETAAGKFEIR